MAAHEGTFENTSWDEDPVEGPDGSAKVTRAAIGQRWSGAIEADVTWETVMTYREDGTADFAGYQRIDGTVDGRKGTVVLQVLGTFDGSEMKADTTVVSGSGTADLAGLTGSGTVVAPVGSTGTYTFTVDA